MDLFYMLTLQVNLELMDLALQGRTIAYFLRVPITKEKVLQRSHLRPYWQHFIFFIANEWAQ